MNSLNSREMTVAVKAIIEAGSAINKIYSTKYAINYKSDHQPVSEADIASNRIIEQALAPLGYPVLSEESADNSDRLKRHKVWIVDPMDGTSDFINRTGEFTIMLGLVQDGRPVLGVIYNPVEKILYYGIRGEGSYAEKEGRTAKLRVSEKTDLAHAKAYVSRFHVSDAEKKALELLGITNLVTCGSSKKICLIAAGDGEMCLNLSDKTWEWDICAADIILSEAGGRLTDRHGDDFVYNKKIPRNISGFVASNGILHDRIIKGLISNLI